MKKKKRGKKEEKKFQPTRPVVRPPWPPWCWPAHSPYLAACSSVCVCEPFSMTHLSVLPTSPTSTLHSTSAEAKASPPSSPRSGSVIAASSITDTSSAGVERSSLRASCRITPTHYQLHPTATTTILYSSLKFVQTFSILSFHFFWSAILFRLVFFFQFNFLMFFILNSPQSIFFPVRFKFDSRCVWVCVWFF